MKEIKISIWVGDTRFEDLPKMRQEEIKQRVTDIYSDIVGRRVIEMIRQGESKDKIIKYLGLNDPI